MITPELKEKLITDRLIPSYDEIATACKVSKSTVTQVMNGSAANTSSSRKVEDYILDIASTTAEKRKQSTQSIMG